jgi:hypothetical protein
VLLADERGAQGILLEKVPIRADSRDYQVLEGDENALQQGVGLDVVDGARTSLAARIAHLGARIADVADSVPVVVLLLGIGRVRTDVVPKRPSVAVGVEGIGNRAFGRVKKPRTGVTGVTDAVCVRVELINIGYSRTVITKICPAITIRVWTRTTGGNQTGIQL